MQGGLQEYRSNTKGKQFQITCARDWQFGLGFRVLKRRAGAYREGFESKAQNLEAEHIQVSGQVDRTKVSIEAKQRAEEDIRRDVEIAKLGAENALVERVRAIMLLDTSVTSLSA